MGAVALQFSGRMAATVPRSLTLTIRFDHELAQLPWYGVFDNLEYQVNGTEVTLTGQVVSEHPTRKSRQ